MTDQQTGAWARSVHPLAWIGGLLVIVGLASGGTVHGIGTLVILVGAVLLAVGIARSVRRTPALGRRPAYWVLALGAAIFLTALHVPAAPGMILGALVAIGGALVLTLHKPAPVSVD